MRNKRNFTWKCHQYIHNYKKTIKERKWIAESCLFRIRRGLHLYRPKFALMVTNFAQENNTTLTMLKVTQQMDAYQLLGHSYKCPGMHKDLQPTIEFTFIYGPKIVVTMSNKMFSSALPIHENYKLCCCQRWMWLDFRKCGFFSWSDRLIQPALTTANFYFLSEQ